MGYANTIAKLNKEQPPFCYNLASFLILSKVKAALGLD
jgi:hypothetical protein